jgi:hypothetical protein
VTKKPKFKAFLLISAGSGVLYGLFEKLTLIERAEARKKVQ